MRIKYRNNILRPNYSIFCTDCDMDYDNKLCKSCFELCTKINPHGGGFSIVNNDYEILEL